MKTSPWILLAAVAGLACSDRITVPDGLTPSHTGAARVTTPEAQSFVYVANEFSASVSVVAVATNSVAATIPLSGFILPGGIAASPDGSRVFVANNAGGLTVINTSDNSVAAEIAIPALVGSGFDLSITSDAGFAYLVQRDEGTVAVIDLHAGALVATIDVGFLPSRVALTPDGTLAYVANFGDGTVSVIETSSKTVVATIPVGAFPNDVAVSPNGSRAYVANWGSGTTSVIDISSQSVVATWNTGAGTWTLEPSADGATLYVAHFRQLGAVSVVDAANGIVTSTHDLPGVDQPNIKVGPTGRLYLTDYAEGSGDFEIGTSVTSFDPVAGAIVANIDVGTAPFGMAVVTVSAAAPPPEPVCSVTPATIWPPNNRMVPVAVTIGGSGVEGYALHAVSNDETGVADADGFTMGEADTDGFVRASRSGRGSGRTYTLTYDIFGAAGQTASCSVGVRVPHDQGE